MALQLSSSCAIVENVLFKNLTFVIGKLKILHFYREPFDPPPPPRTQHM